MRGLTGFFRFAVCLGAAVFVPGGGHAGVTMDGTLGRSGGLSGPAYSIASDLGRLSGNNLFHSFGQFSLSQGESATFSGPASVANIIGRVTGGSASNIDGILRSTIPAANLYLVNPAGLIFGPHAALDVGGSFYASSASYVKFPDGSRFDALGGSGSVLSSASPEAFGFLGGNHGGIVVNGSQLRVGTGQEVLLAGSALSIDGQGAGVLAAPGGRVALYGVAAEGEIGLADASINHALRYGDVRIGNGANILADGTDGTILIRAGRLEVANSSLFTRNAGSGGGMRITARDGMVLDGALLQSTTDSTATAGSIVIDAGTLVAVNQSAIDTSTFARGDGGQISVTVGDLSLTEGSRIRNHVIEDSTGHGGNTAIRASGTVTVSGRSPRSSAVANNSFGGGDAGLLEIEASRLIVSGGTLQAATTDIGRAGTVRIRAGEIDINAQGSILAGTDGRGNAGSITVNASRLSVSGDSLIDARATGGGRGGSIGIQTGTLDLSDGGAISNRTYYFQRASGDININATEYIHITGRAEGLSSSPGSDEVSTGVFSFTGNVSVATPELTLRDSGGISTRTWNDLYSGNLSVETDRLSLIDGGHISADAIGHSGYHGGAGNVTVNARESILISGIATRGDRDRSSGIQSGTRSSGDAGRISLTTPSLRLAEGSIINTGTGTFGDGSAGEIVIHAGTVEVASGSSIWSASRGYGGGGNIMVAADEIRMDHGWVTAYGTDDGSAGRISLTAPRISMVASFVTTETSGAEAGDIWIESGSLSLTQGSWVASDNSGYGNAGNITIHVGGLFRSDDSAVSTRAAHGGGGNIDLRADSATLSNVSFISATVIGGSGDGGNVTITADGVAAVGNSDITARADQGHGGRIVIDSKVFLRTADVDLDASSNVSGNEGVVEVNAPKLDISGSLVVLPSNYLDVTALLDNPCLGRYADQTSSFVLRGRGGIPIEPDGLLQVSAGSP